LNYAVDLGFLETDRLPVKTQIFDYCILLNFLGFSRPNPLFNGLHRIFAGFFSHAWVPDVVGGATTSLALGTRKGMFAHGQSLSL
jgi:hypothetical protein